MGSLPDLSFGLDQVCRIPGMIGSHCPAQVSTLTWQILCEYRRGIEIVSEDNMSETVIQVCQSDHHPCRQPRQFVDLSPVLVGVNLQVVAICCHCISGHPQLDARFDWLIIHKLFEAQSTLEEDHGLINCHLLVWDVFILEALSDSVKNVPNLVQLVLAVDIFPGVNEAQVLTNLEID